MDAIISSLFLSFSNLSKHNIPHAITTRSGGVSGGSYESFNLAKHVGDNEQNVEQNREILRSILGKKRVVFANQIHSDIVVKITKDNLDLIHSADSLITNDPDIAVAVMVADCVPILICDPISRAVGAVHAGWRGVAKEIVIKTIDLMTKEFRSNPSDLIVGIGPAIKSCCYEVDSVVAVPFKNIGLDSALKQKSELKWQLDLQDAIRSQLMRIGVINIEIMELCTSCDKRFFSYRRENITGRFVGAIAP